MKETYLSTDGNLSFIHTNPYRLVPPGNTNHGHHPSLLEPQRSYQQHHTDCRVPSNALQSPCLFHVNSNAVEDPNFDHRRSQSQPPHRLRQRMQIVRPDSGGGNVGAKRSQPQRNNQSRQPQVKESSSSSHRRGHFPHWLFPHDHQPKHSRSPPPSTTPPPPPPRNTALRCKPLTRSVEVQTEPPVPQSCCCTNTDFNPLLYESKNVTSCWCTASQGQPIMLHHYHMHHYYHCEEQQPQQQQHSAIGSTSNSVPGEPQGTGFRTSSPLIKLSATWPPNIAITGAEEAETTTIMTTTATETQSPQQEDCCELSPSTEEAPCPPTHVSSALRTVESPQEQVITPKDDPQEDQRGVFLQNIAQLKRTGWYWGPLTIEEAELLLQDRPNGSFLVRDSGHELYILSLSFRAEDRTYHTRIEHTGGKFGFAIQGGADTTSSSIAQFINHVIAESERGKSRFFLRQSVLTMSPTADQNGGERVTNHLEGESHYVEARLLYPVSRFLVVHSLAHLCRFEILLKVRKDHIDHLPLPDPLKKYLHERQYYTEFVQAYLESIRGGEGTEQVSSKGVTSLDS